jgi:hypothetical protein
MQTLLLDLSTWDVLVDSSGNIAVAMEPYSLAQDVASAVKTFLGEIYYNTTLGVPYFQQILGKTPPLALFQQYIVNAALTVPDVVSATCVINSFTNRTVQGQVLFTDINHQTTTLTL